MRALDWSKTPLGPIESWPQSLRSAISICLGSGFPINLYWGPEYVMLYNDGYAPIAGGKHPWALGKGGREVWPEIWDSVGESFARVLATGEATYLEDSLLLMHRHGYTEECYFNYTLSPIRGESGRVEGIFNAVMETTYRVINARRNHVLRELGERVVLARSARDACTLAASTLGSSLADVTFCALYLVEDGHGDARLVAEAGLPAGAFPARLPMGEGQNAPGPWPRPELGPCAAGDGTARAARLRSPGGNWPEPTNTALVAPFLPGGAGEASGFLIMGASPRRAVDEDYLQFAERAAALVARAVSTATAFEVERKRAEALAELDRAKTVFFSNVSHEFRTPLTLMLGPTEDALASPDGVLRGPALEMVHRNELRLLKLVNTLLDFSRLEAGRIEPPSSSWTWRS
ncbi:histidine kinase dimerization/phospho-acceptor domain-containing protein [Cystobacter fuscus]